MLAREPARPRAFWERMLGRQPRSTMLATSWIPEGMLGHRGMLDRLGLRRAPTYVPAGLLATARGRLGRDGLHLRGAAPGMRWPGGTVGALAVGALVAAAVLPWMMIRGARQAMMGMNGRSLSVAQVMTRDVVTALPGATARELAELMERHNVGTVIISSNGQLRGLVTDRQLVTRCMARGLGPDACRAEEIMTAGPAGLVTASPEMDLLEAARLMGRHRVRRLPVVEGGTVVGILSVADLAGEVKEMVSSVMDELSRAER